MVAKLLKYDLKGYFRTLLPMYAIVLAIALANRVLQFFENGSTAYDVFFISSIVLLVVACLVCLVMTVVSVIQKFYKNLFTREGYLSFTLPVSVDDHLHAKAAGSLIVSVASVAVVILAACVAALGEMLAEVWKAGVYLLKELATFTGAGHLWGWSIELILLCLTGVLLGTLFFYFCICLGQRAKKNRVLAAVGVFFIVYVVEQILGTVVILVFTLAPDLMTQLVEWLESMKYWMPDFILGVYIVANLVLSLVCYLVCRHTMTKKLNLE